MENPLCFFLPFLRSAASELLQSLVQSTRFILVGDLPLSFSLSSHFYSIPLHPLPFPPLFAHLADGKKSVPKTFLHGSKIQCLHPVERSYYFVLLFPFLQGPLPFLSRNDVSGSLNNFLLSLTSLVFPVLLSSLCFPSSPLNRIEADASTPVAETNCQWIHSNHF